MSDESPLVAENAHLKTQLEAMNERLQGTERLSQLRAWAIDRAVSVFQLYGRADGNVTAEQVLDMAEKFSSYTNGDEVAKIKETVQ